MKITELGYGANIEGGICAGFTSAWIQSFISGEPERSRFFKKVEMLLNTENISQKIQEAREKKAKFHHTQSSDRLTEDENLLLEIPDFIKGILLYQNPENYRNIFGRELTKSHIEEISKYVKLNTSENGPRSTKSNASISMIHNESLLMGYKELKVYFAKLEEIIKNHSDDLVISLSSPNHQIGIHYNKEKGKWVVINTNIDDNILGKEKGYQLNYDVAYDIANQLYSQRYNENDLYNIQIAASPKLLNSPEYQNICQKLSELQQSNLDKLSEKKINENVPVPSGSLISESDGTCTYAIQTVGKHDITALKYLIEREKIHADTSLYADSTLAEAFQHYHPDVVLLLCRQLTNDQLNNKISISGKTPIQFAIQHGDNKLFNYLLERKVDMTVKSESDETLLHYAVKYQRNDMLEILLENASKTMTKQDEINYFCNMSNLFDKTPLSLALNNHNFVAAIHLLTRMSPSVNVGSDVEKLIAKHHKELGIAFLQIVNSANDHTLKNKLIDDLISQENALGKALNKKSFTENFSKTKNINGYNVSKTVFDLVSQYYKGPSVEQVTQATVPSYPSLGMFRKVVNTTEIRKGVDATNPVNTPPANPRFKL